MNYMLNRYLDRVDFDSYEDFIKNYKLSYPDDFNFGFDIVDGWAEVEPEKRAITAIRPRSLLQTSSAKVTR